MNINRSRLVIIFITILILFGALAVYQKIDQQNKNIQELVELSAEQHEEIQSLNMKLAELESTLNTTEKQLREEKAQKEKYEQELIILKKIVQINYAVVGIDSRGNGVVIPLEVTIRNGNGSLFLDVTNILFDETLQSSVQRAIQAAGEITRTNIDEKDILISIGSPTAAKNTEIAGGSGGAAITIAIIAAMEEQDISKDILITGTIERYHFIGEVGLIKPKAIAVKEEGAKVFIVPEGQEESVRGLEIIEMLTIEDAWYFIKKYHTT